MTFKSDSNMGTGRKRCEPTWKWTEDLRLQLIQVVTDVERQSRISGESRTRRGRIEKWNIVRRQLKSFSVFHRIKSQHHFSVLYCAYKKLKRQVPLSSISFPALVGGIKLSEKIFLKLRDYDAMLEAYDGDAVKLTNYTEGTSKKKLSCSEDDVDVNVDDNQSISLSPVFTGCKDSTLPAVLQGVSDSKDDVDVNVDDDQSTSLSPPFIGCKESTLPGVPPGVSNSEGSQDALAHDASMLDRILKETEGVRRDTLFASGVPQDHGLESTECSLADSLPYTRPSGVPQGRGLETSECSLAESLPYTRPRTKRPRENQNLTLNCEVLEGLLDTWLEEKGKTTVYTEIALKGLLEEKQIVKKVRDISRDPNMRGRVSEFTSVDKEIQRLALKQMQLTVEAMYEKIKKQMREMVEQTNQDVLSIVGQFSNSFTSVSQ